MLEDMLFDGECGTQLTLKDKSSVIDLASS
jgi:hypothetical protein